MSKKIQQKVIPIPTILITIILRIFLIFSLIIQIKIYKKKLIFKNDF